MKKLYGNASIKGSGNLINLSTYNFSDASIVIFAFNPTTQDQQTLWQDESATDPVTEAGQEVLAVRDFRTNAVPGPDGQTAKTTLQSRGWTVNTE
jgi:hypothetical protein